MSYETSLLFNLLAQKRGAIERDRAVERGYDAQMRQDILSNRAEREQHDLENEKMAQEFGGLYADSGKEMPEFNADFSESTRARMKEAASMGAMAQLSARRKAEELARGISAAARQKQEADYLKATDVATTGAKATTTAAQTRADAMLEAARLRAGHQRDPRTGRVLPPKDANFYLIKANQLNAGMSALRGAAQYNPRANADVKRYNNLQQRLSDVAQLAQSDPDGASAAYESLRGEYGDILAKGEAQSSGLGAVLEKLASQPPPDDDEQ